jgi:hypothetical protein
LKSKSKPLSVSHAGGGFVFLEDDLSGRSLFDHPEGSRDKNYFNGHSARRAATIKKQALITKGVPTISPIKGSVIKPNTASNAPSTRRMLPTLKLESLSERQDLALMSFLLFRPCSEWTTRQRRQRYDTLFTERIPAGMFFLSSRAEIWDINFSCRPLNIDWRHTAFLHNPYSKV